MWLGPGNTRVTVGIRMPEPDPASGQGDWRCGFAISGLGRPVRKHAYGVDAVQALQLAMVRIRLALEPYRDRLTWSGCTLETAFPMQVPYEWGADLSRRIEDSIEREVADLAGQIEARLAPAGRLRRRTPGPSGRRVTAAIQAAPRRTRRRPGAGVPPVRAVRA
ncbi:DUF6968 family protein [Pseudoxanthomonas suwonensis]